MLRFYLGTIFDGPAEIAAARPAGGQLESAVQAALESAVANAPSAASPPRKRQAGPQGRITAFFGRESPRQ